MTFMLKKINFIILTCLILVGFGNFSTQTIFDEKNENDNNFEIKIPHNALSDPPINISGNIELGMYCNIGEGIETNPYIIENLAINTDQEYGINLFNVSAYLIIRNCTIIGTYEDLRGIVLTKCSNINITENRLENYMDGIFLLGSANNSISKNTCINNRIGISLSFESACNKIFDNNCSQNFGVGIMLDNSDDNLFENNYISSNEKGICILMCKDINVSTNYIFNNTVYGISLEFHSNNNSILDNFCYKTNLGINIAESDYNIIKQNSMISNVKGISLKTSNYNAISENNISKNDFGLIFENTFNNSIWKNKIFNSTVKQVNCSDFADNQWSFNNEGNYWSDYEILYPEATHTAFYWDIPYEISVNITDYHPLFFAKTPIWIENPSDQEIEVGNPFIYDLNATCGYKIAEYRLNDTTTFEIDHMGIISNSTTLIPKIYFVNITVMDENGGTLNSCISITVINNVSINTTTSDQTSSDISDQTNSGTSDSDDLANFIPGFNSIFIIMSFLIITMAKIHKNKRRLT